MASGSRNARKTFSGGARNTRWNRTVLGLICSFPLATSRLHRPHVFDGDVRRPRSILDDLSLVHDPDETAKPVGARSACGSRFITMSLPPGRRMRDISATASPGPVK